MEKHFKHIATVGSATFVSRCLGLLRDMLLFGMLGVSSLSSAFLLAFTIPNLFRRLLGEGALSSAFIPLFSEALEQDGEASAFGFLNYTLTVLIGVLFALCLLGSLLALGAYSVSLSKHAKLECELSLVLLPYVFIACIAAIIGASLNVLHHFLLPALSAVWLNLGMICAMALSFYGFGDKPSYVVWALVVGVFAGGIFQVVLPARVLIQRAWKPKFSVCGGKRGKELLGLFLPAVLGASVFQINNAVSNFLAFSIDHKGVSLLYLSNRLLELPLGLFAVTIHTVLFPALSRDLARNDLLASKATYRHGIRLLWSVTWPAALGLVFLAEPIVGLLFQWGRFTALDVALAAAIVRIFALAIPFYALAAFSTRGFHALKDTKTPVRLATVAFGLNLSLALLLIKPLGVKGLAYSSLVFAVFQASSLHYYLRKKQSAFVLSGLSHFFVKTLCASGLMGLFAYALAFYLSSSLPVAKVSQLFVLLGVIPLSICFYLSLLHALKIEEYHLILGLMRKRFSKTKVF